LGERFAKGHVKPNPKMKYSSGVRGVKVLAGIGNLKVIYGTDEYRLRVAGDPHSSARD
jgi:hypothetical protein